MDQFIDIHTHRIFHDKDVIAVYNQQLHEKTDAPEGFFSAGLHPWYADKLSLDVLSASLDRLASDPKVIAFGETGLDKACNIPLSIQQDVFELHLKKAVDHNKPIILHCVKSWDEIIEISSGYPVKKILHGYNGSVELTGRLLREGFYFSVGIAILNHNSRISQSIQTIPLTSLFFETDTAEVSIKSIYAEASKTLKIKEDALNSILFDNFKKLKGSELK